MFGTQPHFYPSIESAYKAPRLFKLKVSINTKYTYRENFGKIEFLNPITDRFNESLTHKTVEDLIRAGAQEVK